MYNLLLLIGSNLFSSGSNITLRLVFYREVKKQHISLYFDRVVLQDTSIFRKN